MISCQAGLLIFPVLTALGCGVWLKCSLACLEDTTLGESEFEKAPLCADPGPVPPAGLLISSHRLPSLNRELRGDSWGTGKPVSAMDTQRLREAV